YIAFATVHYDLDRHEAGSRSAGRHGESDNVDAHACIGAARVDRSQSLAAGNDLHWIDDRVIRRFPDQETVRRSLPVRSEAGGQEGDRFAGLSRHIWRHRLAVRAEENA